MKISLVLAALFVGFVISAPAGLAILVYAWVYARSEED